MNRRDLEATRPVASYEMGTQGAVAFLKGFGAAELVEAIHSATPW